ncbi:g8029 [Coccomyxa elongata]
MAANPIIESYVKGNPETHERGDCPFSHRALLTLAEKHVPYKEEYIDFNNKPKWLFDVNPKGSVPVIHDLEADKWVPDSSEIVDYLEDRFPDPSLGKHDAPPHVGEKLFPSFVAALKAKKDTDEESKKIGVLVQELEAINNHLRDNKTPYLGGERPNQADLGLAPKLYHVEVAMREFKGWEIPDLLSNLKEYNQRIRSRDSWKQTYYPEEKVVQGWKAHIEA